MSGIRVAIADDQALVRTGFRLVLETYGGATVVGEAATGRAAIALARRTAPDVVLMDIRMPDMDGLTATRLVTLETSAKVIVVTTFGREDLASEALRVGASAFLVKDASPQELLTTVQRVHEDVASAPAPLRARSEEAGTRPADRRSRLTEGFERMTPRERDVFVAVGQGLDNAEIAERLFIAESTVKTHVGRVLAKLGARDRVGAVIAAYDLGTAGG